MRLPPACARVLSLPALLLLLLLVPRPGEGFRDVSVGARVPTFTLSDAGGKPVTVPTAGRPVVIVFWRPGQRFSDQAVEDLAGLARGLEKKGVDVLAVAEAGSAPEASRVRARTLPLRFLLDTDGRAGEAYGIVVFPSTAVADADGRLRYYLPSRNPNYRLLVEAQVQRALGEISEDALAARFAQVGEVYGPTAEFVQTTYKRGVTLAQEQRYEDAAATLSQALALAPNLLEAHLQLGYVQVELGDATGALKQFEYVLKKNPSSPGARVGRGIARLRLGEIDEGIRLLEEAVVLNPEPVRGHYELGRAYEAKGDLGRATHHYRWAYLKLVQGRK